MGARSGGVQCASDSDRDGFPLWQGSHDSEDQANLPWRAGLLSLICTAATRLQSEIDPLGSTDSGGLSHYRLK